MINNRKEIFISVVLIMIGIYFLIDKFLISAETTVPEWLGVNDIEVFLQSSKKMNDSELKRGKTSLIFISHNNDCTPCVVEIQEFIDLIEDRTNLQAIVVFVGSDIDQIRRSIQILDIKAPIFYGDLDTYKKLIGNEKIYNQIIVFNKQGYFLNRKYLSKNQISTIKQKVEFLTNISDN